MVGLYLVKLEHGRMNNMKRLLIYILLIASFLVLYYALAQSRMNVGMIGGLVVAASTTTTTAAGTYYYSDSGTGTGRGADNAALAANITCGQAGNITKLGVKIKSNPSSACSHIEFALYDGITPFSQLSAGGDTASVNEDSGCGSGGWNDYTLSSSVAVTLNQVVRVAMKCCTSGESECNLDICEVSGSNGGYKGNGDLPCSSFPPASFNYGGDSTGTTLLFRVYIE